MIIAKTREQVAGTPRFAPELVDQRRYHEDVYGFYGYPSNYPYAR